MTAEPVVRPLATVGIHVVLYENDPARIVRLAGAVAATLRHAAERGALERGSVRFGDCSRWPCLADRDQREIAEALADVAEVTFTHFGGNLGSGGGSNLLAAEGDEDAIWVLNPDTYPAPTALTELLGAFSRSEVAVAEARQVPIEHPKQYDAVTGDTEWACGFALLVRRVAFEEVGGFDDHFFPLYCDDVDLSWRLRLAGWTIRHVPRSVVFHDKPISDGGAVRWTPTAARSTHLARLFLYRRYGQPALEAQLLADAHTGQDPILLDAAREFEARRDRGDVPEPVEGAERVAHIVDGHLSPWRFSYAR